MMSRMASTGAARTTTSRAWLARVGLAFSVLFALSEILLLPRGLDYQLSGRAEEPGLFIHFRTRRGA